MHFETRDAARGDGPDPADPDRVDEFRHAMVDDLLQDRTLYSTRVARAMRGVPRHLFASGVPLEEAYSDITLVTDRDEDGHALHVLSAPGVQATMLQQADVRPGQRVLEIGSGGYNAALIADLTGPDGEVTTVDTCPEQAARTRRDLDTAGYPHVQAVHAKVEQGVPDNSPFDLILVTVESSGLPPAWAAQLETGGRLVAPLAMRGLTRSIVFTRESSHWVGRDPQLCGYVRPHGDEVEWEQTVALQGKHVSLRLESDAPEIDVDGLSSALSTTPVEYWSRVNLSWDQSIAPLDLWLATCIDQFAILTGSTEAVARDVVARVSRTGAPTMVRGDNFGYRIARPIRDDLSLWEVGVRAHGPQATPLAHDFIKYVREWAVHHRGWPGPRILVHPSKTSLARYSQGRVVNNRHARILISWFAP
ncbi:methyltransferase, FxLD system [Sciscionella marina]|uniref:methyltransferase, FxLD system n=1 Tax=Sciscionella marina TaxID=508770 RepID=UPI0003A5C175|nr:methyltransferase, FxLD system [Sciscionella marina]